MFAEGPACVAAGVDDEALGAVLPGRAPPTSAAGHALQASAAAARATGAQQQRGLSGGPPAQFGGSSTHSRSTEENVPASKIATLNGAKPPAARVASARTGTLGMDSASDGFSAGAVNASAGAPGDSGFNDVALYAASQDHVQAHKRSWSIQDALDQHAGLCQQKELLAKNASARLRTRRTHMELARFEVQDALQGSRNVAADIAACPRRTQAIALKLRRFSSDLSMARKLLLEEDQQARFLINAAEAEVEKSRYEMKVMKQAIDDKSLLVASDEVPDAKREEENSDGFSYCANCKVGGHGQRFCEYLLKRPRWRVYPNQKWFEDEKKNAYHCPLGKRLVDFTDESHFSRLAMYLKGRVWLEDKTKMWEIVPDLMPDTYVIENRQWKGGLTPPADHECPNLPWFVKEADRNWGTSVNVCARPSQCMDLAESDSLYVVQQHIRDPLLMDDGRKCHIKFYVLLVGQEDGKTWNLYTCREGYLSISPHAWSAEDLSKETQVTIIRSERIEGWKPWPAAYPKCKAGVAEVIKRAVALGKLEGRPGKKQFEIFSSDFMVDTRGDVWLFEFNMSPVLKDPADSPTVHDGDMITEALDLVVPWEGGVTGLTSRCWDPAGEFVGEAPAPKPTNAVGSSSAASPKSDRKGGAAETSPPADCTDAEADTQAATALRAMDVLT